VNLIATIDKEAKARGLPYLIVGGYAVIAHGYPRVTFDLDLAIRRSQQEEWLRLVQRLGYSVFHDGGAFLQLTSPEERWPLDLMLLNDGTFEKLHGQAVAQDIGEVRVPIVSLLHLIALKVHALKNTRTHRFLKDFQDVTELVTRNKINLASPELQEIFERYGTPELYGKISRACTAE
jgi:predicted nucleotidyltransferase